MTLRYLQTLVEIGVENNTTTIFPVPVEMLTTFLAASPKLRPESGEVS